MRLYIIRHADPDYPNNTITPAGHLEARALAKRMVAIRPHRIYSSPLPRASQTMQYTADALGMSGSIEEWTAEMSDCRLTLDPWGEMVMWDVPGEVIRAHEPHMHQHNWHSLDCLSNPLFRQRFNQLKQDSDSLLARHGYVRQGGRYRCIEPHRQRVAVFCHGGFGLCWMAHLLEIPLPLIWAGFHMPPSSVTTVLFDERSKDWATPRCIGFGDVSHLYEAGLPVQPAGIKANVE